jgi:murein DD-endopeptidase MepM/ murein hydrolase activator NlpD
MPQRSLFSRMRGVVADPRAGICAALALVAAAAWMLRPSAPPPAPEPHAHLALQTAAVAARVPPVGSDVVLRDELGPGETLSGIWERNGRPAVEMAAVVAAASAAFDVRQLRVGTPIEIHLATRSVSPPSSADASAPLARISGADAAAPIDSVVLRLDSDRRLVVRATGNAGFRGELVETPVREVDRTYVGCIQTSLYAALETDTEDFTPLALELDRIYGGQIDFYSDLQPGDCVAVTFNTFVRPDGSFRIGRIDAAEFMNRGTRLPAIWFEAPDGSADYYDLDGKSLKRQFLKSPLKFTRISSGFTMRRFHPILKRYRAHPGIDYVAPAGTPVQAAGNGVVAFAGWQRGYGNFVQIKHGKVYETSYAHLSRIAKGVRPGARVSQGDVIGFVGSTGLATGAHLDYRFSKGGKFVNPLDQSFPNGDPVAAPYQALFAERRERALQPLKDVYRTVLVDGGRGASAAPAAVAATPLLGAGSLGQASVGDD